jgi:hypothetical protein
MHLLVANLLVVVLLATSTVTPTQAKNLSWIINEAAITGSHKSSLYQTDFIQYDFDSTMTLTDTYFREEGSFYVTHYCLQAPGDGIQTQCIDLTGKPYLVWGTWLIDGDRINGELNITSGSINFYADQTGNNRPDPLQSETIGSTMTVDKTSSKATVGPSALFPQSVGSYAAEYRDFQLTAFGNRYWKTSKPFPTSLGFEGVTWRAIPTDESGIYVTTGSGTAYFLAP